MRLMTLAVLVASIVSAMAHDHNDPNLAWYRSQEMTPESRARLGVAWKSCCDEADHFKTRFRLLEDGTKYGTETYQYLRDGKWKTVPADIIQRKKTPDGTPVLFINKHDGRELCFIIDEEGI